MISDTAALQKWRAAMEADDEVAAVNYREFAKRERPRAREQEER